MKLVSFDHREGCAVGRVELDEVVELDAPTMREYFERDAAGKTGRRSPLAEVALRAPIVPKKFFHTAGNFREHHDESLNVGWSHPVEPWIVFFQNVDAIIGTDEAIVYPEHLTSELDYELELAVVIARDGADFDAEEAMDYVGGYLVFNDITARDIQRARDEGGCLLVLQGDPYVLPNRPFDRDAGRGGRSARALDGAACQWRAPPAFEHEQDVDHGARCVGALFASGVQRGGHAFLGISISGVAGFSDDPASLYLKPGDVVEAEIEEDRRAPESHHLVGGRLRDFCSGACDLG